MPELTRSSDGWRAMNATSGLTSLAEVSCSEAWVCLSHQLRHASMPTKARPRAWTLKLTAPLFACPAWTWPSMHGELMSWTLEPAAVLADTYGCLKHMRDPGLGFQLQGLNSVAWQVQGLEPAACCCSGCNRTLG